MNKPKLPKITFKNNKPTGRYRFLEPDSCDIKLNKKVIGTIQESSSGALRQWDGAKIRLRVLYPSTAGTGWRWVTLKHTEANRDAAKIWLKANWQKISDYFCGQFNGSE